VLLSIAEYMRLTDKGPSIVELLGMPEALTLSFGPPKANVELSRQTSADSRSRHQRRQ